MRLAIVLSALLLCGILSAVQAIPPPRPAPAFWSDVVLQVSDHQHEESYEGTLYHNTAARSQLVSIPSDSFARLERWDLVRLGG